MTRRFFLFASAMIALATILLGSMASSSTAMAQDTCCVRIRNTTNCHVTICVRLPGGALRCVTVGAHSGDAFRFLCDANTAFGIRDACDIDRLIPGECIRLLLRGGCCAKACLRRGEDGCYEILVEPTDGPCACEGTPL